MGALEDTKEQLTELKKLREAHRRRLSVLQVQAAQFGYETPPAITTEMEDIDRQLTSINQKISLLAGALPAQLEQLGRSIRRASSRRRLCRRPSMSVCSC